MRGEKYNLGSLLVGATGKGGMGGMVGEGGLAGAGGACTLGGAPEGAGGLSHLEALGAGGRALP